MSFLAPLGLLVGALAIPLVGMYFLKIRRRRVIVPSTLLWEEFARTEKLARPFQRLRRNLLLLLQLLVLAFLVFAFARPYITGGSTEQHTVVLLLDGTASMAATDVQPSRFEVARGRAEEAVSRLGSGDDVMLVFVGARTEVLVPFTHDHAEVKAALSQLEPTDAEGSLEDGLQLALSLARSRPGVEVIVLSDGSHEDLSDLPVENATIAYSPIGRSSENAAVLALDLRAAPASELDRQVFVTVQNFGPRAAPGTVEVWLGSKMIGLRTDDLPPDEPVSSVFDLPADARGDLQVKLDMTGDVLDSDDVAWISVEPARRRKVLLVGGDALSVRVLAADPRVQLTLALPQDVDTKLLDEQDAILLGAAVKEDMKGRHVAYLGPNTGSPLVLGAEVDRPRIVGWRRTHPLLRFVSWDGVLIAHAPEVKDAAGLEALVEGDHGALLLAGERGGGRVMALAFDPMASDLPLRVAWPVLLLNTVGWLSEAGAAQHGATTVASGSPFVVRVPDGTRIEDVSVTGPQGEVDQIELADGLLRVQDTSKVGLYDVRTGALKTRFAANLHSARESDVQPVLDLSVGAAAPVVATATIEGRSDLWRPLALAGLALLVLEWFAWNRRKAV